MEKLKLPIDSLRVETFELGDAAARPGTVHAHVTGPGGGQCGCTRIESGCNPDVTLVMTGACVC